MGELYEAIIESIRREDTDGFLERFLDGLEEVRGEVAAEFQKLAELSNAAHCPRPLLPYLADLVGLGGDLADLKASLPEADLRRVIPLAVPLWRKKGLAAGLLAVVRLLTGRPAELATWFDQRWILGEARLGEETGREAPWLLDAPGGEDRDEYTTELTVVDEGMLNRPLLRTLVDRVRPVGERVLVRYVDLLEDFSLGKAHVATVLVTLRGSSEVRDGRLVQASGTMDLVRTVGSDAWQGYVASFTGRLVAGGELAVRFAASEDGTTGYRFAVDDNGAATLTRQDGGTSSPLAGPAPTTLVPGHDSTIRVLLHPDGSDCIRMDVDGEPVFDVADATYTTGTVGMEAGPGSTAEWDRIELFELPLSTDVIAPLEAAP